MTDSFIPEPGGPPPASPLYQVQPLPAGVKPESPPALPLPASPHFVPGYPRPMPRSFGQLMIDHNPFYLLSVLCMLFGCYLLHNALELQVGGLGKLLILLGTLNVYELLLIGLAVLLLGRAEMARDGRTLVVLEILFLADLTFLNAELVQVNHFWGSVVSLVVLLLALGKVWLLFRALKIQMGFGRLGYVGLQLLILFGMPWGFIKLDTVGEVPEQRVFLLWWCVALLPVLFDAVARAWPDGMKLRTIGHANGAGGSGIALLYLIVPFISLIAHLRFNHWVWQVPVNWADYAPVLLGLAVILNRVPATKFVPAKEIAAVRIGLPLIALLLVLDSPQALYLQLPGVAGAGLSPALVMLGAIYLTYGYCFFLPYLHFLVAAGVVLGLMYLYGPSGKAVGNLAQKTSDWLIPTTAKSWGILAMVASFLLLGIGAAVSFRKRPVAPVDVAAKSDETIRH
ncbi:MAG: hypothetical protein WCI73_07315 [Phycisphaerae bacterium]